MRCSGLVCNRSRQDLLELLKVDGPDICCQVHDGSNPSSTAAGTLMDCHWLVDKVSLVRNLDRTSWHHCLDLFKVSPWFLISDLLLTCQCLRHWSLPSNATHGGFQHGQIQPMELTERSMTQSHFVPRLGADKVCDLVYSLQDLRLGLQLKRFATWSTADKICVLVCSWQDLWLGLCQ